jgi:hypothetical protein
MRRIAFVLITAVTTVVLGASAALAASPHFTHGPDYTATTTELTATGQAAGLAALATTAQLTANSVVTNFHCVNHGNNFAPGHPAVESPAAGTPQAITPRNGNIKFSPTLPAFVPNAADVCPNKNWKVVVDEVDYLGVVLTISQGTNIILQDGPADFTSCAAGIGNCVFTG